MICGSLLEATVPCMRELVVLVLGYLFITKLVPLINNITRNSSADFDTKLTTCGSHCP